MAQLDEMTLLAEEWTVEQLDHYIKMYEERIQFTANMVKMLKRIRRNKQKRKIVDTGAPRGGK